MERNSRARRPSLLTRMTEGNPASDKRMSIVQKLQSGNAGVSNEQFPLYYESGRCTSVAKSPIFEHATLVVVLVNSIWLAVDADYNNAVMLSEAELHFQIAEHFFCGFFVGELIVRFSALKVKWWCVKDGWFVFDSILVSLMVLETWVLTLVAVIAGGSSGGLGGVSVLRIMRLLRLLRMARMVRLLRALPELLILIKGMAAATRSVGYALCLLVFLMYIFAIIFVSLVDGTELQEIYFSGVVESMIVLLVYGTLLDNIGLLLNDLRQKGDFSLFTVFLLFVLLSAFMVLNLVIGVLCEVVAEVSATEKEAIAMEGAVQKFAALLSELDENNDGQIGKEEFMQIVSHPTALGILPGLGLDPKSLVDHVETIFPGGRTELDMDEFWEAIVKFRSSHTATLRDIVDLRKHLTELICDLSSGETKHDHAVAHRSVHGQRSA
jgi:voltage-gated sodium channel